MSDKLEDMIIRHEGMRLKPYRCTAGKLTIGVGRNLDDNGISEQEALMMMRSDISTVKDQLMVIFGWDVCPLNDAREAVLIDMLFNLGAPRFIQFKLMIAAIKAQDWMAAAAQMRCSLWAAQVGERARELARIMETGSWLSSR